MSYLTLLNLEQPKMTADYESSAPTGISLSDIEGMEQFLIGVGTHTGQVVTPEKAKRCAAVLACIRILTEDLSALRLPIYKNTANGVEEADNHPLYELLDVAPNAIMTSMELREHIIMDMILWGNFYVLINEDNGGDIRSLWPLQAAYVTRRWQELVWVFNDPVTGISGEFTPEMVWRGQMMSPNGIDGQAIAMLAREAIGMLLAAEEQGARLFKNGIQSDFVLESDTEMDKDQIREALMKRHSGSKNAFMPLLLENGLKARRVGLTAAESQYIEARKYQVEDIARVFRIPEVLLGSSTSGKSSTYASAEQFFQSYVKHTLGPWATRIEQTMNRDLLGAGLERTRYFFKHDFSSLLRGDTAARYASYATGIDKGFLSPAWCRQQEGYPYVAGLDYYNKPAPPVPGSPDPEGKTAPTDQSGSLPGRVAVHIFDRERKALIGGKQDPDAFFTHFGGYVEDLTGASPAAIQEYITLRRTTSDRFTPENTRAAIDHLISLCQRGK